MDDVIPSWNPYPLDLLVYFSIPSGWTIPYIIDDIKETSAAQAVYLYECITVVHLENVPFENISSVASLPYVHFVEADLDFNPDASLGFATGLQVDKVVEMLGIHSSSTSCSIATLTYPPFPRALLGAATSVCIIGKGVAPHSAVNNKFYSGSGIDLSIKMRDFTSTPSFSANPDPTGKGTAMASILYNDDVSHPTGIASTSFPSVANVVNTFGMARPSQILKAIEWAIADDSVQVIYCDFETVPSDGTDAISTALDVASMLRKLCVTRSGSAGAFGIKSPGASQKALTVGMAVTSDCYAGYSVFPSSVQGTWGNWHDIPLDVVAPGAILGANKATLSLYNTLVTGSGVSALAVTGLASLFCEKNTRLTVGSWKHLLRINSKSRIPFLDNSDGWDGVEGFGTPQAKAMCDSHEDLSRRFDLGFTENQNLPWSGGSTIPTGTYNSANISTNLSFSPITAGTSFQVYVEVENFSTNPYPGTNNDAILEVSLHDFGNSYLHGNSFASMPVPYIGGGSSVVCTLNVTSPIDLDVACIGAQIIFPFDVNSTNNSAKKNCHYLRVLPTDNSVSGKYLFSIPHCIQEAPVKLMESSLAGTGVTATHSFTDGDYNRDTLPRWETVTFNIDPNAQRPATISYDLAFKTTPSPPLDSFFGGVNFTLFLDTTVATPEPELLQHLSLSPNPAADLFHLDMTFHKGGKGQAYLADMHGRVLKRQDFVAAAGVPKRLKFEVEGVAAGVYVVGVTMGEGRWVRRVVKM